MLYVLIILSGLIGLANTIYKNYLRRHVEDEAPHEIEEHHPVAHIKSTLFLDLPLEKLIMGYFALITLVYSGLLVTGSVIHELDFAMLFLSGIIFFLLIYNWVMLLGIAKRFSGRILLFIILSANIMLLIWISKDVDMVPLLIDAFPYSLTIHIMGVVLGLGGAIVLDIMIFHFLRNFYISNREAVIMHLLSQMIVLGLILLIVSGIFLVFSDLDSYLESSRFLMKMTVVLVVFLNGVILNLYITPKMELISLRKEDRNENETLVIFSFIVGAISALSWFTVFFLAMLDILGVFSYTTLLIAYLILLVGAIGVSLMTQKRYETIALEE